MMFDRIPNVYWGRAAEGGSINGIGDGDGVGLVLSEEDQAALSGLGEGESWWQGLINWGTDTAGKILVPRFSLPGGSYEQRNPDGSSTIVRQQEGVPLAFGAGQYGVGGQAIVGGGTGFGISTGMLIALGFGVFAIVMLSRGGRR